MKQDNKIANAFDTLKQAMVDDPEYAWSWQSNLAMPIMDEIGVTHEQANRAAARLMGHLFGTDIATHEHFQDFERQWRGPHTHDPQ